MGAAGAALSWGEGLALTADRDVLAHEAEPSLTTYASGGGCSVTMKCLSSTLRVSGWIVFGSSAMR